MNHELPTYHEDTRLFREALTFTQAETGFSAQLIEKDYYCSLLLQDLLASDKRGIVAAGRQGGERVALVATSIRPSGTLTSPYSTAKMMQYATALSRSNTT